MAKKSVFTVKDVAEKLGISMRRVRELCERHKIGTLITPRTRILTAAEARKFDTIRREPGNPEFGPGYAAKLKRRAARKKRLRKKSKK